MWGAGPVMVLAFGITARELARGRGSAGNLLTPSTIEVITTAGEEVILFASPRDDGDYAFVNRLKSEWRARVPGAGDGGGEP